MELRRAARLLLFDEAGRVLLFQYADQHGTFWATPGGGLEGLETYEEAALREAREELGLAECSLKYLWERTIELQFRGNLIRQAERFFLARRSSDEVALGENVRDAHALEGILAARWWSPGEILAATERIFPEDLVLRLETIERHDDDLPTA